MEEDLIARLLADEGLAAKVAGRIDWIKRPKGGETAITLTTVSAPIAYTYQDRLRFQSTRVQADVWGPAPAAAITIARLLPPLIEPSGVFGATCFSRSFVSLDIDGDQEDVAAGKVLFRRIMEFTVWHRPAA